MADNSTAKLVLQVDAAVELARSNLRALANTMDVESKGYDRSVSRIEASHKRIDSAMGSSRIAMMEMQHTFRAFGDSVAAGQDPVRAFIMELGRVGQAAELLGQSGSMGKFGKFIGGPYGMALSLGIAALASLAGGHKDAGEASKEQETIENLLIRALKGEEEATKKLADAIRDKTKAAREAIETDRERARNTFHQTQGNLQTATDAAPKLKAERDAAFAAERAARDAAMTPQRGANDSSAIGTSETYRLAQGRAAEAQRRWQENETNIQNLRKEAATEQITLLKMESAAHTDEGTAIKRKADAAEHDLRVVRDREMKAAGTNTDLQTAANRRYVDSLDRVTRQRLKEEKELAERNKERSASTHLRGNDMSTADAIALIKGAGGTVTSGDRSNAKQKQLYDAWVAQGRPSDNPVAPPGASAHNGAHGKHALDIAGMSAKDIDEAFTAAGVHLTKILQERGHIHVEWGKGGPSAETMARRADAAARHDASDDKAYETELQSANQRLARGRAQLADTAEARYAIEIAEIDTARAARDREIDDERLAGRFGKPDSEIARLKAEQLQGLNGENAVIDKRIAKERLDAQIIDRRYEHDRTMLAGVVTLLNLQEQLATTAKERRRIALATVDAEERLARAAVQRAIEAENSKAKPDPQRLGDLQSQMSNLGTEYAAKRTLTERAHESPLDRYKRELNAGLGDIHNRLEEIEVQGLHGLEDDLASAATKALHLTGALGSVADALIRIGLEKGLQALFGLGGGGGGLTAGQGSALNSVFGSIGGGGGIFSGLGFAAGGSPPVGQFSVVGEKGPELFLPKSPGVIIPNHMIGRGGGSHYTIVNQIDAKGAEIGVEQKIASAIVEAAPHIITAAHRQTMGSLTRRGING